MDIWRRAVELRAQFEDEAVIIATENGERCLDSGDMDGYCDWNRIHRTLLEMERTRGARDSLH